MADDTRPDKIQKEFRLLFGSARGRRVLRWLMYRNNLFMTTHDGASPHASAFYEGRRAAILEILAMVRKDISPDLFMDDSRTALIESRLEQLRHDPLDP